jgi:hypothetical protein
MVLLEEGDVHAVSGGMQVPSPDPYQQILNDLKNAGKTDQNGQA